MISDQAHLQQVEDLQTEIFRAMTPAQRLQQAQRLRRQMISLMDAALKAQHPSWTADERNQEVARRILVADGG